MFFLVIILIFLKTFSLCCNQMYHLICTCKFYCELMIYRRAVTDKRHWDYSLRLFIYSDKTLAICWFIFGSRYSRMDQVKYAEDSLLKIRSDTVCLGRPYHFRFFKGCLPQILFGPFLNTLTYLTINICK